MRLIENADKNTLIGRLAGTGTADILKKNAV
jgi:hypothetical protein